MPNPSRERQGAVLRGERRGGNTIIEFGFVAVLLVPLLLGTINLGLNLSFSLQVSQVARDAGHMYVRQLDFSLDASKEMVVRMARGMGMTKSEGKGVVVLTKVLLVGDDQCAFGGLPRGKCPNWGRAVFVQRHTIGNAKIKGSSMGAPPSGMLTAKTDTAAGLKAGDIAPADYLTQTGALAPAAEKLLPGMAAGDNAYIVEAYFTAPEWSLKQNYTHTADGVYARAVF